MSGCDAVLLWGESRLIHTHRALRSGRIEWRECRLLVESAPTTVASGRTGVRAIAVVPLRERNTLQRPSQTIAQQLTALDPSGWLRRSIAARHPYCNFCAAQAEARPRRVGGRTARLWKDCRGSPRPRPRMRSSTRAVFA